MKHESSPADILFNSRLQSTMSAQLDADVRHSGDVEIQKE